MDNPLARPLREFQARNRDRLGCKFGAEGDADIRGLMSTPIDAFSGNTLETLIRDLYNRERDYGSLKHEIWELRREVADLELKLAKRDKLINWCAKRIRRTLRLRAKHLHEERQGNG